MNDHNHTLWQSLQVPQDPARPEELAEIQAELLALLNARDQLLRRLAWMDRELAVRKERSLAMRRQSLQLLDRLSAEAGDPGRELTREESEEFSAIGGHSDSLEKEVRELEQKVRVASFEVTSLSASLDSLRDEIISIAERKVTADLPAQFDHVN